MQPTRRLTPLILILMTTLTLAACSSPPEGGAPTAAANAPATAAPTQPGSLPTLTVCLGNAPNAIHPYQSPNIWSRTFLETLYPSAYYVQGETLQPGLLENLPSLADGSARRVEVQVELGMLVMTANGVPQPLDLGMYIRPAGCNTNQCEVLFNPNEPTFMDQLEVTFTMKGGLSWGDGTPLTADDSVYAFEYNIQNFSTSGNTRAAFTASYVALDDTTTVWTGLPGVVPRSYMTYFWTPLPRHLWEGEEVVTSTGAQLALVVPASYGPYQLENWDGQTFVLYPNLNYSGPNPSGRFAPLIFQVVGTDGQANLSRLLTGECDVLDPSALGGVDVESLTTMVDSGRANLLTSNAGAWEVLFLGMTPASYDDGYTPGSDRADFFSDVRVRQGLAQCLNRPALLEAFTASQGSVMDTFMQPESPLFGEGSAHYAYDPAAGMALLEAAGWVAGEGGMRHAQGIANVPDGEPLALRYYVTDRPTNQEIAGMLTADLQACGVELEITTFPPGEYYAYGEDSPVFGRNFDLAQFSLQVDTSLEPVCHLFLSYLSPGPEDEQHVNGWGGFNVAGWQNAEFDEACEIALTSLPGQAAHAALHQSAQVIFAEELPAIPLFTYRQFALTRPDVCGLKLEDLTGLLYGWDEVRRCEP